MTRRDLLRRSVLLSLAAGAGARRIGAQAAQRPDSDSSDPLFRPDRVQERAVATAADNDPVVRDLEHRLKCTCGCNLDIYTCRTTDFTCTYSPALHQEVLSLRAEGKQPDQVVTAFVAKYGEQVLMAPKPEGFNLAGYLVPGAAVLTAGALLVLVIGKRGRRIADVSAAAPTAGTQPVKPEDAERLRRALQDVED